MSEMDLLHVAASGMDRQRRLLDVAARNVAAAQAATPDHPYPRLVARFAETPDAGASEPFDPAGDDDDGATNEAAFSVAASGETADAMTEMLAVLDAQRAYEANASVFDVGKRIAERTLDVGRG